MYEYICIYIYIHISVYNHRSTMKVQVTVAENALAPNGNCWSSQAAQQSPAAALEHVIEET